MTRPSWLPASRAWGPAAPEGPGLYSRRSPLHLCQVEGEPAGLVGPSALGVFAAQDAGLLVTEGAGAGG